jgi:hypothetical protein
MKIALRDHRGKYGGTWDGATLVFDRDAIGVGETFDVIVLDGGTVPIPGPIPPGPMPSGDAAYVAAVKAQLEAQGVNLAGPCGAFAITQHVAWGLRTSGIGLVSKPSGNNCQGYSVDYLAYPNGDGVDILGDAGGANVPQWSVKPGEFAGEDRWRPPMQP